MGRYKPLPHYEGIVEKLMDGWHPKAIAAFFEVNYNSVITIKNKLFKTILVLKDNIPNRNQFHFFNLWANWRYNEPEEE